MRTVLFDLDGTLTDPKVGITTAVSRALHAFGIEAEPDTLTAFIGPPLVDSFREFYGFTEEQGVRAVEEYRKYFSVRGWAENVPYPGIGDTLRRLKEAGVQLAVATAKPQTFADRILAHFGLAEYFDLIAGASPREIAGDVKAAVIRRALEELGITDTSDAVMVGDRKHDVEGAHQVGLPCVGVLWGYGSPAEFAACGADAVVSDMEELTDVILNAEYRKKGEDTMELNEQIARDLLSIRAVFFRPEEPFTWASGIKSPIYCDNRLTLTAPAVRNDVENGLVTLIRTHYPEAEVLMGTSTAGIAHAAIAGHLMGLPMGYVRSGNKDHGRQNRIEGRLEPGQKVVVVEDLISTGGSCIEVVEALREAGAEVLGIVSIFTYGMARGLERLREADVKNVSLTDFDCIARVAAEEGYIRPEDVARLMAFRSNPSDESWIGGAR